MRLNWIAWLIGVPVGVFGVGTLVGHAAAKRGIPPDQIGRWLVKETTRKALAAYDDVIDVLPDQGRVPLADELKQLPPPPRRGAQSTMGAPPPNPRERAPV